MTEFIAFCIGWAFGGIAMWLYFVKSDLIRTREEYYEAHPEERP